MPSVLHLLVWDGSDANAGAIVPHDSGISLSCIMASKFPMIATDMFCDIGAADIVVDPAMVRVASRSVRSVQSILGGDLPADSQNQFLAGGFAIMTVVKADAPQQLRVASSLTPGMWVRIVGFSRIRRGASMHNMIGERSALNILPPFCRFVLLF